MWEEFLGSEREQRLRKRDGVKCCKSINAFSMHKILLARQKEWETTMNRGEQKAISLWFLHLWADSTFPLICTSEGMWHPQALCSSTSQPGTAALVSADPAAPAAQAKQERHLLVPLRSLLGLSGSCTWILLGHREIPSSALVWWQSQPWGSPAESLRGCWEEQWRKIGVILRQERGIVGTENFRLSVLTGS